MSNNNNNQNKPDMINDIKNWFIKTQNEIIESTKANVKSQIEQQKSNANKKIEDTKVRKHEKYLCFYSY